VDNYGNNATVAWDRVYLPPVMERLNKHLSGVGLVDDDTLYACAYDLAAYGTSPWCDAFTLEEIENFEYELDLLIDVAFGYNLPDVMGPTLGALYVNTLIDRFTNSSGDASAVYLEFGDDTTIDLALMGLGLARDTHLLPVTGPVPASRNSRTSNQVPFAAQMVWEKFSCSTANKSASF